MIEEESDKSREFAENRFTSLLYGPLSFLKFFFLSFVLDVIQREFIFLYRIRQIYPDY